MSDVNGILISAASWLARTPVSESIAGVPWVVPATQTLHILAVATVLGSVVMIDLQVLGVLERGRPLSEAFSRYLPPLAAGIAVLALSGLVLVAGEPTRAPFRAVFWLKLLLVLLGVALTWALPALAQRRGATDVGAAPGDLKIVAAATISVWLAVIVAGRWIGYSEAWPGAPL